MLDVSLGVWLLGTILIVLLALWSLRPGMRGGPISRIRIIWNVWMFEHFLNISTGCFTFTLNKIVCAQHFSLKEEKRLQFNHQLQGSETLNSVWVLFLKWWNILSNKKSLGEREENQAPRRNGHDFCFKSNIIPWLIATPQWWPTFRSGILFEKLNEASSDWERDILLCVAAVLL